MDKRSFMAAIFAASAAPAIVRAESIMRINPRIVASKLLLPIDIKDPWTTVWWIKKDEGEWEFKIARGSWIVQ